jgi:glutamate N-acetyltransferase / amino-acid N-acetyltransferase
MALGPVPLPVGFTCHVGSAGVKDATDDVVIVSAELAVATAAVFTRSRFEGPSVTISRANVASGLAQAVVVISKNANVANGPDGWADAEEVAALTAASVGCAPSDVLIASTGIIGRRYPMERLRAHLSSIEAPLRGVDAVPVAQAMMTTDTRPKVAAATVGDGPARVVGVAKGVGMIEPDMATMIALLFTDASVEPGPLDAVFRSVVDRTFNAVSIDTDTSTSDTAVLMASGAAGPVPADALEQALTEVALSLTRQIARDGEGATRLLEVLVDQARDTGQAKLVAKAIVNSPLVKTAVHGADPNWGRVAMAIGKCSTETDIDQRDVVIRFGHLEVYPTPVDDAGLTRLGELLGSDEVLIHVSLGTGDAIFTAYGCDLSDQYVRINADYST